MRSIRLSLHSQKYPNLFTLIDEEDAELASQYRWNPVLIRGDFYVHSCAKGKTVYLHRLVTDAQKGVDVDHINHDTLDNRKDNLNKCLHSHNLHNRRGLNTNNTSGFLGVSRLGNKWMASMNLRGRVVYREYFSTTEEAARARDEATRRFGMENATFNFPNPGEKGIH